ncbi:transporter substrate-binding domain-containing protein [Endozoicomonas sp. SM1973]|uniref:Transporter substrate-binding domain-containing protein n=1 Tax=Spartinivicinus marinus TaxID=2994442 RepID=A0A853IK01_9GAMM|nr:transporter substrate-binding domain-containing protein [Spartinivicinus marinus]MCX4027264.1 transporter substrate-binding domain-containing protein [Spartinivicinus marinus]NYZ67976.1 transporter substrate-binding domain-containing protein [Spartinivicinus marinus]
MIVKCLSLMIVAASMLQLSANELLVVTENWPPYNYREKGQVVGASTEIVKKVLGKANYKYSIHLYPWARSYQIALYKPNVIIYTILRTPERESLFQWIGPLFSGKQFYLYKLSSRKDITLATIDDAKKYLIGVMRGDVSHQFLSSEGFEENKALRISVSEEENIKKLYALKVDLISGNNISLPIRLKKLGYKFEDVESAIMTFKYNYYMAVSNNTSDEVYSNLNNAFEDIYDDNLKNKIIKKYNISP